MVPESGSAAISHAAAVGAAFTFTTRFRPRSAATHTRGKSVAPKHTQTGRLCLMKCGKGGHERKHKNSLISDERRSFRRASDHRVCC